MIFVGTVERDFNHHENIFVFLLHFAGQKGEEESAVDAHTIGTKEVIGHLISSFLFRYSCFEKSDGII